MSNNHLFHILEAYASGDRSEPWYAATVVNKQGSSYRRPGALMLISPMGQTYGLVSGGCLEAEVVRRARMVHHSGQPEYAIYDSTEEGNIAAELGLGCNGRIGVLIQRLDESHERVLLELVKQLKQRQAPQLLQCFQSSRDDDLRHMFLLDESGELLIASDSTVSLPELPDLGVASHKVIEEGDTRWSLSAYRSPVSLWVIGGGQDAQPLVSLAAVMGWDVTLVDDRLRYARESDFANATRIVREGPENYLQDIQADAVVVMTHNLAMDSAWVKRLSENTSDIPYVGVLGPASRREEVLEGADIPPQTDFARALHGPMGLDLGGDLPESVALSVIAQIHAVTSGKNSKLNPESI